MSVAVLFFCRLVSGQPPPCAIIAAFFWGVVAYQPILSVCFSTKRNGFTSLALLPSLSLRVIHLTETGTAE